MSRYYWTREEEAALVELFKSGLTDPKALAEKIRRRPGAVQKKLERMGLLVVVREKPRKTQTTTTKASILLSKDLLTHEEALKILAGALELLRQPGQDKLELQRFRILVDAIQAYDSVLEKFEKWVEIESRLLEMDKKITELQKLQAS